MKNKNEHPLLKNDPLGLEPFRIRRLVQGIVFIATVATGIQFYIYVNQALTGGQISIARPGGVEGFLPIGASMAWKDFILSGRWDTVHPAAMVIFGFAILVSLLFRKAFCGWFCPVGALSEWIGKAGESVLGKSYQLPRGIDLPLRTLKYGLLGFFVYIIGKMSPTDVRAFLESPYYKVADVKMLYFFTQMSLVTAGVLTFLVVLSLFSRNPWCRYFCPYGALLGVFSLFSPFRIQRNPETCIDCTRCHRICAFHLPVNRKKEIQSPECNGCMDCLMACPVKNTLEFKAKGTNARLYPFQMGLLILALFISMVYLAKISGHWKSNVLEQEFKSWVTRSDIQRIEHPSISENDP